MKKEIYFLEDINQKEEKTKETTDNNNEQKS